MSTAADLPADSPGLRLRQPGVDAPAQPELQPGQGHSREADAPIPSDKSSKTYGRTPDGTGM